LGTLHVNVSSSLGSILSLSSGFVLSFSGEEEGGVDMLEWNRDFEGIVRVRLYAMGICILVAPVVPPRPNDEACALHASLRTKANDDITKQERFLANFQNCG